MGPQALCHRRRQGRSSTRSTRSSGRRRSGACRSRPPLHHGFTRTTALPRATRSTSRTPRTTPRRPPVTTRRPTTGSSISFRRTTCAWAGSRWGKRALLNGTLTVANTAHELGHTFGLPHAQAWSCAPRPCGVVNYGDPYDTMGSGTGDFDSYEKWLLGWITRVTHASQPAVYTLAPIEAPSSPGPGPHRHDDTQPLLVRSPTRSRPRRDRRRADAGRPARPRRPEPDHRSRTVVVRRPLERADPGPCRSRADRGCKPGIASGSPERSGSSCSAEDGLLAQVALRLDGHDAAQRPTIVFPGAHVRRWADTAGDVARLERTRKRHRRIPDVDRRRACSLDHAEHLSGAERRPNRGPSAGAHTITIVAIDRAGNRSRPAIRRFVVGSS